jgi:ATP-dependent Clp protease adaptor protein ClpS
VHERQKRRERRRSERWNRRAKRNRRCHKDTPEDQEAQPLQGSILNDDYTPMEFVVHILERFFNKNREEAVQVMLHVHRHGVGICGVFTYEVAETKVAQVIEFSRRHQHPLQCTMEKE